MRTLLMGALCFVANDAFAAGMKTWDGRHSIEAIEVTVVYFVPKDRQPLPDWRERVDYYCRRIELFHRREFLGQSTLKTIVHPEPLVSESETAQLRQTNPDLVNVARRLALEDADDVVQVAFPGDERAQGEALTALRSAAPALEASADDRPRAQPDHVADVRDAMRAAFPQSAQSSVATRTGQTSAQRPPESGYRIDRFPTEGLER